MHYTVYKITNNLNNKFYIGKHQTYDLGDGYMGSGKWLKRAIQKYGIENFSKEILHVFETEEEMNAKEKELVVISEQSYNLCEGGKGGFSYINRTVSSEKKQSLKALKIHRERLKNPVYYNNWKNALLKAAQNPHVKEKRRQGLKASYSNRAGTFTGKKHNSSSKRKIGTANSLKQKGKNNSQFGTFWVTNGKANKKVRENIPEGFVKGRIF